MMDVRDEEEREGGWKKHQVRKGAFIFFVFGILIAGIFILWKFGIRSSEEGKQNQIKQKEQTGEENFSKPFILDDEKEKEISAISEKRNEGLDKKERKEELSGEKGDKICEYKVISLPELLEKGDFIDVRLSLADGRDYTVLSCKKVGDFLKKEGREAIWLSMSDLEIIAMESAVADLRIFRDAKLYVVIRNGEKTEWNRCTYPINFRSEKLIKQWYGKEDLEKSAIFLTDEELNEDRRRLIELGAENALKWKEAATYWKDE